MKRRMRRNRWRAKLAWKVFRQKYSDKTLLKGRGATRAYLSDLLNIVKAFES